MQTRPAAGLYSPDGPRAARPSGGTNPEARVTSLYDYLVRCLELDAYLEDQAIPQPDSDDD